MSKKLYWRIKYGYGKNESIRIDKDQLRLALYAQATDNVVTINGVSIRGGEIKAIEPDYSYYTGWLPSYEPRDAEDYIQIQRSVPIRELSEEIEKARLDVRNKIKKVRGKSDKKMLN